MFEPRNAKCYLESESAALSALLNAHTRIWPASHHFHLMLQSCILTSVPPLVKQRLTYSLAHHIVMLGQIAQAEVRCLFCYADTPAAPGSQPLGPNGSKGFAMGRGRGITVPLQCSPS